MAHKSNAMLRVVTGQGIIPRPAWLERILTMFDTEKTRIDLSRVSDEQLKDLGLTRADVQAELTKPEWNVPNYWRSGYEYRDSYRNDTL